MRSAILRAAFVIGVALPPRAAGAFDALAYVSSASSLQNVTIVDARAQVACLQSSVRDAHCLPAADFLGSHGRLASFRQIFWLLGTARLSGHEHVLVVGDDQTERDFVAGMLYLSGQRKVSILTLPISQGAGFPVDRLGPGTPRAMIRKPIYQGTVRGDEIVLQTDIAHALATDNPPLLLDGRSEAEYWGERIRAWRGGHLPGAQLLPIDMARRTISDGRLNLPADKSFVVYGHDTFESVAYFTVLRAGARIFARVLLDGWADWADHPALPVASATYPDRTEQPIAFPRPSQPGWLVPLTIFNAIALLALAGALIYACKPKT